MTSSTMESVEINKTSSNTAKPATSSVVNSNKRPILITDFFANQGVKVKKTKIKEIPKDKENVTVHTKGRENVTVPTKDKEPLETLHKSSKTSEMPPPDGVFNINTTELDDYTQFCKDHDFDRKSWIESLTPPQRELLDLEIKYLHISWLALLHKELVKPYFIKLKQFLKLQQSKTVFPPEDQIYSWSHYTPLPEIKCLVLGQDPYHNFNQAHGLAFSVLEPTKPPPSLVNIYKALRIDFPDFISPDYKALLKQGTPGGGNLTKWAKRGVLMLNAALTVEAHKANSHANMGWETFTEEIIRVAIKYHEKINQGFVIMAWGSPAQKRVLKFNSQLQTSSNFLVIKSVHPSPLSAHRGFFELEVFKKCNQWLEQQDKPKIDWGLLDGNVVL